MEFPEGNGIRVHTRDDRSYEAHIYEWGELGVLFDYERYRGQRQRLLVPWSNIAFIITDLGVEDA